ncbi:menaquinone biosynthesis decarboxylase [Salinivirga cyanobacteriivorans]|nr:menaquinone biosynthesis decarboxylase [Salinivirga cyanobacteriivorans]
MRYNGLNAFINRLKNQNELLVIDEFVDPELEITEIADRFSKEANGGKALLFRNTGTSFPILINAYGSQNRIHEALGIKHSKDFASRIEQLFNSFNNQSGSLIQKLKLLPQLAGIGRFLPRKKKGNGICQQQVHHNPDLNILPILKCWPHDGGKFITLPIVHTIDPENGMRNVGMYRMQQMSSNTTGMHWHKHKVGARHYQQYKDRKEKMPVSVVLGGDPVYTYAATAPAPDHFDEYIIAGFIRKAPVKLVKCITNDIFVPEDVDIVIEGYIDPEESWVNEGPFGDHTGFYSLADLYPLFHVTCITHRNDAVFPATIVGIPPMEDAFMGEISEHLFLKPLQIGIAPEVKDMHMPVVGVVHNLVIVSANVKYEGQAFKIANALWGAGQMMFTKYIIVVDHNIDIRDYNAVFKAVLNISNWQEKTLFSKGPLDILDHSSDAQSVGGKLCIDATVNQDGVTQNMNSVEIPESIDAMLFGDGLLVVFTRAFDKDFTIVSNHYKQCKGIVVFVEKGLQDLNINTLAWYILGNTDPVRDIKIKDDIVLIDALRKHGRKDFKRPWPDLVVMDDETIRKVDNKWSKYNIGNFIASPSNAFKSVTDGKQARLS